MPRYNVNHNNKWASFSTIVDAFVTEFVEKQEYETWRKQEYGTYNYKQVEGSNILTMKSAVFSLRLHHTHEKSIENLLESGLSQEEAEKLIYDIETECWCPILKEDGKYECPNCGSVVVKDQKVCDEGTCELKFIWR